MRPFAILTLALLPHLAQADPVIDRVLDTVVLPGVARLAETSATLARTAVGDCRAESPDLLAAWNGAMDAWLAVQGVRFGPLEEANRRQSIAYWPDTNAHRPRALARILSGQDPILQTPDRYGDEPVSARGLYALETMLYDPAFRGYGSQDPGCALVVAASADLAQVTAEVNTEWAGFADVMRTAGEAGNPRFLDASEARQAVFTALMTSLQFDILERLGRPLGTFDKPRPLRAEGRTSGRSQRNLELSLEGQEALMLALLPAPDQALTTREDFERVRWMASTLDDPDFAGVDDPGRRFKLEALQTALTLLRTSANGELSAALGVSMGLNALDGD